MKLYNNLHVSVMAASAAVALTACSSAPREVQTGVVYAPDPTMVHISRPDRISRPNKQLPRAVAYRMSGPYAPYVAVTLSPDGSQLLAYPAPSDLTPRSSPVELENGWYLSRCGITADSRFTRYTYGEYMALPEPPSPAEIMESLIPGASVTTIQQLPYTPAQALDSIHAVNLFLRDRYSIHPDRVK